MKFWRLLAHRTQELMICSWGAVAELSRQKAASASAAPAASPLKRLCHASRAQTAPPEVPLRPTTSYCFNSSARRSLLSTPAVKAVWLPPPWHAMATRLISPRPSITHLRVRRTVDPRDCTGQARSRRQTSCSRTGQPATHRNRRKASEAAREVRRRAEG